MSVRYLLLLALLPMASCQRAYLRGWNDGAAFAETRMNDCQKNLRMAHEIIWQEDHK